MKTSYKFVLAMVGSAAVGGLAVQALHAQAKLPAYFISEATIKDPDLLSEILVGGASQLSIWRSSASSWWPGDRH